MGEVLLSSLFYGRGNGSTERLSNSPEATQLISSRSRVQTHILWLQSPVLTQYTMLGAFLVVEAAALWGLEEYPVVMNKSEGRWQLGLWNTS